MPQPTNQIEKSPIHHELLTLRTEIIESEKARIDLLKYKLIAVAALGAIGLGFSNYDGTSNLIAPDYVLCIIPFMWICYAGIIQFGFL